ncbi:zf-HC2 domain-containing protein [Adhaeribacter pallidiroseus]|uniref:Putative zinc-finger domain-containing protein n=1 Tax=Adhaeribacter pallidiroseus TaxID=2072847 RepID=A0A369QIQ5_9BACT|nr:zf-HC2 domain-containing protein [Adhaeribacter pallidiroseus]RDC64803.1 hypothetical protein AHMF7616_03423 [Adhaeribacter pallidiroseus]
MDTTFTMQHALTDEGPKTDCQKVVELLDVIIDGEATTEDRHYFFKHLETCQDCFQAHDKHQQLKSFLKDNIKRKLVPINLMGSIKTVIHETI